MNTANNQTIKFLILTVTALSSLFAFSPSTSKAEVQFESNSEIYDEYFTIDDTKSQAPSQITSSVSLLNDGIQAFVSAAKDIDLLKWIKHQKAPAQPTEKYNRLKHFGTWVNDPTDDTCFNTRAKVMVRDSEGPVTFKENNRCSVAAGKWNDPYTGEIKNLSTEVQIDHVVALKHAYDNGAFKWSMKKRCLYANFMGNKFHLLTVDGHENMSKGDRSPDQYMPPNNRYACDYLEGWLKIKVIWNLTMTPPEVEAIDRYVDQHNCTKRVTRMSRSELIAQRAETLKLQEICRKYDVQPTDMPVELNP